MFKPHQRDHVLLVLEKETNNLLCGAHWQTMVEHRATSHIQGGCKDQGCCYETAPEPNILPAFKGLLYHNQTP